MGGLVLFFPLYRGEAPTPPSVAGPLLVAQEMISSGAALHAISVIFNEYRKYK